MNYYVGKKKLVRTAACIPQLEIEKSLVICIDQQCLFAT